jgi:hypothetical protein
MWLLPVLSEKATRKSSQPFKQALTRKIANVDRFG